ncbi:hypothetical protein VF14_11140 [Nostoc linckia z18]|jgi:hypothetical protein|uniref:Uncharacterized protein n=2 Tax=Nostoc linckia TaxID=92942 RepID=A0A9Q5ZF99_NOSLI|nr:hypothetical protein VF02_08140 [Nostoc linckia z1]PHJ71411.1 hypothetical protein VF05_08000 [Nostoc linckia z3]PHJ75443.1 hypothetical protein VF03_11040 [Nostoc linckia z2]PHJ84243.1 hypothetical protein VF06_10745 [Nostoc linckia z4]PHJ90811.1 hypothetical protein VF07_07820 [Nostoc linckia z6]PHJ97587.1 hypothetical protein VF04_11740 [Nostoc linckia z7]PHJ99457.1 hypothetical protein VF09_34365 [Nostoc linckia z9]PHK05842.1 hypothetical protein VF08_06580 [Nostoc linckia z8]PHK1565
MLLEILNDYSFVHPNIINSQLHELLLRLPKNPNSPNIEKFGFLNYLKYLKFEWTDEMGQRKQ